MTRTEYDLATAAASGASWLDEQLPIWFRVIDRGALEMRQCTHCVLGQLHDRLVPPDYHPHGTTLPMDAYYDAILFFGLTVDDAAPRLGFTILGGADSVPLYDAKWDALNAAWQAEIRARRNQSSTQITNAPEAYDGFGTATIDVLPWRAAGGVISGTTPNPYRRVHVWDEHLTWQRERYRSGLYLMLSEHEWSEAIREPYNHYLVTPIEEE